MNWRSPALLLILVGLSGPAFAKNHKKARAHHSPHTSSQPAPRKASSKKQRRVAVNTAPTGTVVYTSHYLKSTPPTGAIIKRARSVEITPPAAEAPSFVSDLNTVLMSQEIMNMIDGDMRNRVGSIRVENGFYYNTYQNNGFTEAQKDRRGQARMNGMTVDQDLAFRRQMAGLMRSYMLSKGLRKFLESREETKKVGETYGEAMDLTKTNFVTTTKSGSVWHYNMGVNPMPMGLLDSWFLANNEKWLFESRVALKPKDGAKRDPMLRVARANEFRNFGVLNAETVYFPMRHTVHQKFSHPFTPTVTGGLECAVPYKADDVMKNMFTSVSMSYAF
jgi:hypothetical protein